jgi:hypothetical protein
MRHSFFLKFFQISIATILISLSMLAQALPCPKDIDAAVVAGKLEQAESMLREVISEKPQSVSMPVVISPLWPVEFSPTLGSFGLSALL